MKMQGHQLHEDDQADRRRPAVGVGPHDERQPDAPLGAVEGQPRELHEQQRAVAEGRAEDRERGSQTTLAACLHRRPSRSGRGTTLLVEGSQGEGIGSSQRPAPLARARRQGPQGRRERPCRAGRPSRPASIPRSCPSASATQPSRSRYDTSHAIPGDAGEGGGADRGAGVRGRVVQTICLGGCDPMHQLVRLRQRRPGAESSEDVTGGVKRRRRLARPA